MPHRGARRIGPDGHSARVPGHVRGQDERDSARQASLMAGRIQAHIRALVAACAVVLGAAACADDGHLPPSNESGGGWAGHSSGSAGTEVDGGSSGDDEDAGADQESCTEQGGTCLSDPDDPTMPAFCEAIELVEIEGACADVDHSCCAPAAPGLCEEAGGQCLANPSGGMPFDCADLGLVDVGAPCPTIDQICCA
jgi:hypothetical protein